MIFIGVDVHVRNSYLHVSDETGQRLAHGRVGNTLGEFAQFLGPFEGRGPIVASMESTTNSRAVVRLLERYGHEAGVDLTARVLDARRLRVIAESVCKNDQVDAAVLNELTRSGLKLPTCYVPDDEVFALREHLRARSDLVRMRTMVKNRVHAVLHRRGVITPAKLDLFTKAGRAYLQAVELDPAGRAILDRYLGTFDAIQAVIKQSTDDLKELSRQDRWCKRCALLQTMPGVGLITALTILAELGDLQRFTSRSAVANYAGLVPVVRDSNDKRYRGSITKRGSTHLRHVLTEAAWVAVGRSVKYAGVYQRISDRKSKPIAIVAVARKMLEDAFMMIRKDQVFREAGVERPRAASSAVG